MLLRRANLPFFSQKPNQLAHPIGENIFPRRDPNYPHLTRL
jgi:hypothetical protein